MFQRANERTHWVTTKSLAQVNPHGAYRSMETCEFCNEDFSELDLPLHQRNVHKQEITKQILESDNTFCGTCIKSFETEDELLKHTLTAHLFSSENALRVEPEIFICNYCHQIFFTKLYLTNHIAYTHVSNNCITKSRKIIKCHFCKSYVRICNFWAHSSSHPDSNHMNVCFKCNKKFKNLTALREHYQTHSKNFFCNICRYSCTKESSFNLHVRSHRNTVKTPTSREKNIDRYFVSKFVGDVWKLRKSMYFSGVLLPAHIIICILCREICYTAADKRMHIQSHRAAEPKKLYSCECGEAFSSNILLKQHKFQFKKDHSKEAVQRAKNFENSQETTYCMDLNNISMTILPDNAPKSINIQELRRNIDESELEIIRNVDLTEDNRTRLEDTINDSIMIVVDENGSNNEIKIESNQNANNSNENIVLIMMGDDAETII